MINQVSSLGHSLRPVIIIKLCCPLNHASDRACFILSFYRLAFDIKFITSRKNRSSSSCSNYSPPRSVPGPSGWAFSPRRSCAAPESDWSRLSPRPSTRRNSNRVRAHSSPPHASFPASHAVDGGSGSPESSSGPCGSPRRMSGTASWQWHALRGRAGQVRPPLESSRTRACGRTLRTRCWSTPCTSRWPERGEIVDQMAVVGKVFHLTSAVKDFESNCVFCTP